MTLEGSKEKYLAGLFEVPAPITWLSFTQRNVQMLTHCCPSEISQCEMHSYHTQFLWTLHLMQCYQGIFLLCFHLDISEDDQNLDLKFKQGAVRICLNSKCLALEF